MPIIDIASRPIKDSTIYPDNDLEFEQTEDGFVFRHKDGRPYEE